MKEDILSFIETQKEEILYLQRNLVSIPALSPENGGDGESKKAEFVLDFLTKRGFPAPRVLSCVDPRTTSGERPNILCILKGEDSSRTLWVVSHLDVVPAGDKTLWKTDPFELVQQGDFIFGRGTEDNHHGLVASILAAKAFLNLNQKPLCNMGLLFVSDEETGSKYGLDFLLKEHSYLFSRKDEFLIPDFGTEDSALVEVAEKSMLWLKFIVKGRQCHASTPHKGVNSLVAASKLILMITELYHEFQEKDPLFDPPISTFEPTKKEENVPNINTIPGRDIFYVDCRILPKVDVNKVIDKIMVYKKMVEEEAGVEIKIDIVHKESSSFTSPECGLVKKLTKAISKIYGCEPCAKGVGGGTVAAFPRKCGYDAVAWATLLGTAHQPNEHTSLTNIINDAKVMSLLLLD